jgi:multidrug efflux system membrane fusion protein
MILTGFASIIKAIALAFMKNRNMKSLVLCAVAGLALSACAKNPADQPKIMQSPPVPVSVDKVVRADVPVLLNAVGVAEADAVVSVKSQVAGVLQTVHFREGKLVKKGDRLFTIDPRPFEAMVRQTEAVLARDSAQLENSKRDVERSSELVKDGFVSKDKYDSSRTNAAALEAVVRADRAALDTAKLQLGYCDIRSPISGVAGSLTFDEGSLLKVSDDKAIVTIRAIQPIRVSFSAPEKRLGEIRDAMAQKKLLVKASFSETAGAEEIGFVEYIENTVDTTTGSIVVKAVFKNKDMRLWPGQFVNVTLELGSLPGAVLVPTQAVQAGQNGTFVAVVEKDMTARIQPVRVGASANGMTVIESGLSPGETVITDGYIRIKPGVKVEIKADGQPKAAGR